MRRLLQGQKIYPTLMSTLSHLAQEFGQENFPKGYAGTPAMGTTGAATFNAVQLPDQRIQVTGSVTALAYLAQLFGVNQVATSATGVARKNEVEIMLVLDRSGSMGFNGGKPIADLKTAATSFIGFFKDTEDTDKVGLISFATGVTVDVPLGNNFVKPMTKAIDKMNAIGGTNAEDALAHTMGPGGLTDQTGVAPDKRVQQFVIFFTDGNPTASGGSSNSGTDTRRCGLWAGRTHATGYADLRYRILRTTSCITPVNPAHVRREITSSVIGVRRSRRRGSRCRSY